MRFGDYWENRLPDDMAAYQKRVLLHQEEQRLPTAPAQASILPVVPELFPEEGLFWAAWYASTLLAQAIERLLPRHYSDWVMLCGKCPVPGYLDSTLALWQPTRPCVFLRMVGPLLDEIQWAKLGKFLTRDACIPLEMAGIYPPTLYRLLLRNAAFNAGVPEFPNINPHEFELAENIRCFCGNPELTGSERKGAGRGDDESWPVPSQQRRRIRDLRAQLRQEVEERKRLAF